MDISEKLPDSVDNVIKIVGDRIQEAKNKGIEICKRKVCFYLGDNKNLDPKIDLVIKYLLLWATEQDKTIICSIIQNDSEIQSKNPARLSAEISLSLIIPIDFSSSSSGDLMKFENLANRIYQKSGNSY